YRVEVAIELECRSKVLGRISQLTNYLRQRGLQVALKRLDVRLCLALCTTISFPLFDPQLGQVSLRRLRCLLELRKQHIELAHRCVRYRCRRCLLVGAADLGRRW